MSYRRKILVVDDSSVNRMIVSKILSDSFEIIEAEDGLDAMEVLAKEAESISVIILDIVMPIMDGYTFLENYSKIPQAGSIPVIVVTQMDSETDEVRALAAGAADFITKPFKPDIIRHRINNIIKIRETASLINTIERDMLTSLYTKEAFYTRAAALMQYDRSNIFDIVCTDIENFRLVNDLYGETEGDNLLCTIAESLDAIVGSVGGIVGRLGGDVFLAIMPVLDQLQWQEFVEEFQSSLKESRLPTAVQLKYGIYRTMDRSISIRAMCDRAQQALNSIKGKYGASHAYYDEDMGNRRKYETELASTMREALSSGQFAVYYQPKYELETEKIIGAEALVRWLHPEKGMIFPGEFIPLFESNGFITQMDFYVWEMVCKSLSSWINAGNTPLPVSVNVSRIDIYNESLPDMLMGLVQKYKIPPKLFHLEITETAYVKNQQQLIYILNQLKKCGFIIEMDDFGSGFSSLTMLTEIPVDVIKLDMSLMASRKKNKKSASALRFIVNLARELGIPVIAEGIETRDDLNFLKALKCKYGQGYFFSKPVAVETYEKLMLANESILAFENAKAPAAEEASSRIIESAFRGFPCGLASFEMESGVLHSCNDTFAGILGYETPKLLIDAQPIIENLFAPEFHDTCRSMMQKLGNKIMSTVEAFGVAAETAGGSETRCTLMLKRVQLDGAERIVALLSNIAGENAEFGSYNDLKAIIGGMPGELVKFRADNHQIDFLSENISSLNGCGVKDTLLKCDGCFDKMIFLEDREYTIVSMLEQLNMYGEALCDFRIELQDGGSRWLSAVIHLTRDKDGTRWCYAVLNSKSDICERQASGYNTHIDHLTRLLDKTAFEAAASERLKEGGKDNVMITLDLDNFALVNENYGHKHCDELLRVIADFLRREFRERDLIARIGSDEFAILVTRVTQPESVLERMNGICKRMIAQIGVSCSMGVAAESAECSDYETLLDRAMRAMRQVKKTQKNGCAVYTGEND